MGDLLVDEVVKDSSTRSSSANTGVGELVGALEAAVSLEHLSKFELCHVSFGISHNELMGFTRDADCLSHH